MTKKHSQPLRGMTDDPFRDLWAAVILQAFDDYVINCRVISRKRRMIYDGRELIDPYQELAEIRRFLVYADGGSGVIIRLLGRYMAKKKTTDVWGKVNDIRRGA